MTLVSGFAIYFILWWLTFFCTLPFGVRTQAEADEVVAGSAPSAPTRPLLRKKIAATTVISLVLFAGLWAILASDLTLDDVPLLPRMEDIRLEG